MTIKEILSTTQHRPWKLPLGRWAYYQEWNDVVFLHWPVAHDELQKFIPDGLTIDLFEGQAWVSVVAFNMEKIRPRYLPAFPPVSDFYEINVRTYVKHKHRPGVYFLSMEGEKRLSCFVAKALSELPYKHSVMKRSNGYFESENVHSRDKLTLRYKVGGKIDAKSSLDKWLTERYALYQDSKRSINTFEIHHVEWPVFNIIFDEMEVNYPRFEHLFNDGPALCHYSPGVQVIAWGKDRSFTIL